ncbi:hypothetical protein [Polaromonas sp.]|uniref:hypothetical protein n=1 Tax=Polaromonas sp. TaxID=1869339 RepID=UPI003BB809CC
MILQLDIEQLAPGLYEAHCECQTPPTTLHGSISAALKHYGTDIPADFCRFVEVRYDGVSSGTTAVTRLANEPEAMARQLMGLAAAVYEACQDMTSARRASAGTAKER